MPTYVDRPVRDADERLDALPTELAGLAELSRTWDHERRLALIVELAAKLRAEDAQRSRVQLQLDEVALPVLAAMPADERRRLLIRVLCELVAYEADA